MRNSRLRSMAMTCSMAESAACSRVSGSTSARMFRQQLTIVDGFVEAMGQLGLGISAHEIDGRNFIGITEWCQGHFEVSNFGTFFIEFFAQCQGQRFEQFVSIKFVGGFSVAFDLHGGIEPAE